LAHPVIELLTGLLFVWWYWGGALFFELTRAPFEMLQPLFWLLVGILFIMIVVADALYLIIPDITVGMLLFLTILYRVGLTLFGIYQLSDLILAVVGMILMFSFFAALWLMTRGRGMGLGDVKLVVPLALLLGWPKMMVGIFLAFVLGATVGVALILGGKRTFGQTIPFGPFLVAGTVLALLLGDQIVRWYIGLL
jgi:prepilin signal peptidase PulO-like enzyme (type II secretory pathway)